MNLTLEVISANGSSLGAGRRKVFGAEGGRIGRATDCDWVLPSPARYISRHHATIICKHGQFYVKAEGENGVAINSPNTMLGFDEPRPIHQGDRLYIDEYEILVSVPNEARAPRILDDPFADDSEPQSLASLDVPQEHDNLDPLRGLPGAAAKPRGNSGRYVALPHGDILSDSFVPPAIIAPPPVSAPPAPPSARGVAPPRVSIPSDPKAWNKTIYGLQNFQQ